MLRRFTGVGLLLGCLFLLPPALTGADKKKPDAPPVEPTDSDKLAPGNFNGKLKTTPGSDGSFVVDVAYDHLALTNPGALQQFQKANPGMQGLVRDQQRIAQLQNQVATARTQQQAVRAMQQLQSAMARLQQHQIQAMTGNQAGKPSPYTMQTDHKDVAFHITDDTKVRFTNPPQAFDEKGNIKKYTSDELKKLKGKDTNLPGYESSADKLAVGQQVKVTTVLNKPKKPAPKPDAEKKDDKPNADAEKKDAAEKKDVTDNKAAAEKKDGADNKDPEKKDTSEKKDPEPKTVVSLILVQGDETTATGDSTPDKKKKKKDK